MRFVFSSNCKWMKTSSFTFSSSKWNLRATSRFSQRNFFFPRLFREKTIFWKFQRIGVPLVRCGLRCLAKNSTSGRKMESVAFEGWSLSSKISIIQIRFKEFAFSSESTLDWDNFVDDFKTLKLLQQFTLTWSMKPQNFRSLAVHKSKLLGNLLRRWRLIPQSKRIF